MIQTESSIPQNDHPTPNSLYLIGTGFSKGICPKVPLNNELLPELLKCNCSPELEEYSALYPTDNIEELFTWLDMKSAKCERVKEARKRINAALAQYFSQFGILGICDSSKKWLKRFAEEVLKPNDAIVSLNYDCLLEGALDTYVVWSPNGGYPASLGYPLSDFSIRPNAQGIVMYKVHGSVNFHEGVLRPKEPYPDQGRTINIEANRQLFPSSCQYVDVAPAESLGQAIIAPSYVKIPHFEIARMMLEVLDIAETANTMVIVGCSLRPEDSFLRLILRRFYVGKRHPVKRLIVVDPHPDRSLTEINKFWPEDVGRDLEVRMIRGGIEDSIVSLITELKPNDYLVP